MSLFVDEKKCTGCDICVPMCPSQAISHINNKAVIDHNKCKECLLCIDECPTNAIYQILEKEDAVVPREDFILKSFTRTAPQPRQSFWSDSQKQKTIGTAAMLLLSGIKKLAGNFLNDSSSHGLGKREKCRRRHGRW
jgi:electron transport complex protein RnfB